MDADLHHDERLLPRMLDTLKSEPMVDAVVGSRYVEQGSIGTWNRHRAWLSIIGHVIPIRFVVFTLVGGLGLVVHLAVLWLCLNLMQLTFELSQATATGVAIIGNFTLNNWLTYHDRRLIGWKFVRGLLSFALICGFGAVANVGIASLLFTQHHAVWWVAGIAGAAMSAVWNYAVTSTLTWRE
jgi:dolichol-phosphate mannosyltransferase